jgi:hypothetical protein
MSKTSKAAASKANKKWRAANKEHLRAYGKSWRQKNPDKQAAKARRQRLRRLYGLTVAQYEAMFVEQGGVCAICRGPSHGPRPLAVDHDHVSGAVRALLCDDCNKKLGVFESPMRAAFDEYLTRHRMPQIPGNPAGTPGQPGIGNQPGTPGLPPRR